MIPVSSFSRLSASDGQSSPVSPSSLSLSTSEVSPSSPKVTTSDEFSRGNIGAPAHEQARQPNRARGQQHSHHNHKRTTSPSIQTRSTGRSDSKPASPKNPAEDWAERVERHSGSLEDMSKEKKAQGQRNHRSSSPRKTSKREHDSPVPMKSPVEPQSPRRPAGQQPSTTYREGKDRRYKEEDVAYWQEGGAAETSERHKKNKRVEQDGPKSHSQTHRERSEVDSGTLSRRSGKERTKFHGSAEEVHEKDPRGSSSSIQDPSCNGTVTSKKAPITPGPWKVPSSTKIQSQLEPAYPDI